MFSSLCILIQALKSIFLFSLLFLAYLLYKVAARNVIYVSKRNERVSALRLEDARFTKYAGKQIQLHKQVSKSVNFSNKIMALV